MVRREAELADSWFGARAFTVTEQSGVLSREGTVACGGGELYLKYVQFEMPITHPTGAVSSKIYKVVAQGTKFGWKYQF